ncbi:class I SAM-dependent methyltransferase [Thermodesulforhabdus norvegica]|uniref:Methyltransferase domain-containing protein n=1 Tax=Thermodesulforhabdus norvegica TaxID=39841 RepID=A0A1I4UZV3_9BACT|nr:class I SAM-dependent methyltransferase [Thermodesulforhabdus norvegica]SFM94468.1 Methyltransferase domain-containing protein [Thermodesulforhabdus norvegica]
MGFKEKIRNVVPSSLLEKAIGVVRDEKKRPSEFSWMPHQRKGHMVRYYRDYISYLEHQASKFPLINKDELAVYDREYRALLRDRLTAGGFIKEGMKVLCLGARQGTEVKAFLDLGCFAVGVDINPGDNNHFVLYGDFHSLQFPDGVVDVVFTNSLDHVFDIQEVLNEVRRVLDKTGFFVVEAIMGKGEGIEPDEFASFWWETTEDLAKLIEEKGGFSLKKRHKFSRPWEGYHMVFEKL